MKNKNLNKHKPLKFAATALMSAVLFTVSSIPALAYSLPPALEMSDDSTTSPIDTFYINVLTTETDSSSSSISMYPIKDDLNCLFENVDFSESDFVCIDENGTITYGTAEPQLFECNHNYLAAQATHHDKNSDGSCTITYYSAKRCSKCGRIVVGDRIATMTYVTCPH